MASLARARARTHLKHGMFALPDSELCQLKMVLAQQRAQGPHLVSILCNQLTISFA